MTCMSLRRRCGETAARGVAHGLTTFRAGALQDKDERAKLSHAALTGAVASQPLTSDLPSVDNQTGPLTFVVSSDFVRRAVQWGKDTDFLIYMYYPGRWNVTDDTHAKLRPKWMKMAQLLDPQASNGAFVVAWIVRPWPSKALSALGDAL